MDVNLQSLTEKECKTALPLHDGAVVKALRVIGK